MCVWRKSLQRAKSAIISWAGSFILTRLTAQGPRSRNLPSSSRALSLCTWLRRTCSTIGNCSGGFRDSAPYFSHTSNAVSCSVKNGLCWNVAFSSSRSFGSCLRQRSRAKSQACLKYWIKHSKLSSDGAIRMVIRNSAASRRRIKSKT